MRKAQRLRYEKPYACPAGVDEAGRGPLAGPVVAGACVLPKGVVFDELNDSKKLTPAKREQLFEELHDDPRVHCAVGIVDVETIDRINILQATIQAMIEAVNALAIKPDHLLVDGLALPHSIPCEKIIRGDQLCQSIMAASILAKVTRDRIMLELHSRYPDYGFDRHKGYATAQHLPALEAHGRSAVHRTSFRTPAEKKLDLALRNG